MNTTAEAADQIVRMILNGSEVMLRLTGSGAKNIAVMLYTIYKGEKKTKGAERLTNMLRSGKPLRVYTFETKDLQRFKASAKQYGIVYTVLKEKDKTDGVFDVFVHVDDDNKMSRIIERFNLAKVDTASLRAEIVKEKQDKEEVKPEQKSADETPPPEKEQTQDKYEDGLVDQMFSEKPIQKEEQTQGNPTMARTEEDGPARVLSPSSLKKDSEVPKEESLSEPKSSDSNSTPLRNSEGRISVMAEIARIKKEVAEEKKREAMAKAKDAPELPKMKTKTDKER